VNQILSGGGIITTGWGESKPISFGPILVTGSDSKLGAIQLRDVVLEANGFAKVQETCTLKDTLKTELKSIGYSGDADQHVLNFILGLFGKSCMMLFGNGNARRIKFDSKENFPSTLNLIYSKGGIVPVIGCGKTLKKE
jgi:hypothetical protein